MAECWFSRKEEGRMIISNNKAFQIFLEMIDLGEECPLTGSGNSMRPLLKDEEDILIMTSIKGKTLRVGDIILYERKDGQFVIHRLYKKGTKNTFWFVGDNQFCVERDVSIEQLRAVAKSIIRNGKAIDCEHGIIRSLLTFYMYIRVIAFSLYQSVKQLIKA